MVSVNLVANTDLRTPEEFRQLVVKEQDGVVVRLGDIADVVLGAENYEQDIRFNGESATFMGVWVLPTANSLDVIAKVREALPQIQAQLPAGMKVGIPYDSTEYIHDAIGEVLRTLTETLLIVIVVIFLFLGSFRSVLIPIVAIPISLVGAVFLMLVAGFTVNLLTLLAIVLSVGLVVDDAIVMVENVERHLHEGKPPHAGGDRCRARAGRPDHRDDDHAGGGLRAGRHPGRTDRLAVPRVRVHAGRRGHRVRRRRADAVADDGRQAAARRRHASAGSPAGSTAGSTACGAATRESLAATLRYRPVVLTLWVIVALLTVPFYMFSQRELAPAEDQGFFFGFVQASPNATLDQTKLFTDQIYDVYKSFPEARQHLPDHASQRRLRRHGDQAVERADQDDAAADDGVDGSAVEDRGRARHSAGAAARCPAAATSRSTWSIASAAEPKQLSELAEQLVQKAFASGLFIFADADLKFDQPQAEVVFDRDKLRSQGVDLSQAGRDLSTLLGGNYVNRFSIQGRSYKVIPQVDARGAADARSARADLRHRLRTTGSCRCRRSPAEDDDRAARAEEVPAAERRPHPGRDSAAGAARSGAALPRRTKRGRSCRRASRSTTRANRASCGPKAASSSARSCCRRS